MEWIDRLAETMHVEPLTRDEADALLAASREVAHRVERKVTPLATFVLGMGVASGIASGAERGDAIRGALDAMERLLPDGTDEPA